MNYSSSEIERAAGTTGFNALIVEKVYHLLDLLNALNSHPYLKDSWALKGGSAVNLFLLELPRLSVDIDLNYTGTLNRDEILTNQPRIEQATQAVFSREGLLVKRVPEEHAGGKWRLSYRSFTGQSSNLEVDFNFMFRQPLWDVQQRDSHPVGDHQAKSIPILDLHEIAAGKLAALLARHQARDLFDCSHILQMDGLINERLRIAFILYGAMNRRDWRTISIDDVDFDPEELARLLAPTLPIGSGEASGSLSEFARRLVDECRRGMSALLPFSKEELQFLDLLLDRGEIDPSLLTVDASLRKRIKDQPLLQWKALNIRKHKKLE